MFKAKATGFAEVRENLAKLKASVQERVVREALREAGEPIRATAAALCHRDPRSSDHLADHIGTFDLRTSGTLVRLAISYPAKYFQGHLLEWGTEARSGVYVTKGGRRRRTKRKHHATKAYPFLRPAWDGGKADVLNRFGAATWRLVQAEMAGTGR